MLLTNPFTPWDNSTGTEISLFILRNIVNGLRVKFLTHDSSPCLRTSSSLTGKIFSCDISILQSSVEGKFKFFLFSLSSRKILIHEAQLRSLDLEVPY